MFMRQSKAPKSGPDDPPSPSFAVSPPPTKKGKRKRERSPGETTTGAGASQAAAATSPSAKHVKAEDPVKPEAVEYVDVSEGNSDIEILPTGALQSSSTRPSKAKEESDTSPSSSQQRQGSIPPILSFSPPPNQLPRRSSKCVPPHLSQLLVLWSSADVVGCPSSLRPPRGYARNRKNPSRRPSRRPRLLRSSPKPNKSSTSHFSIASLHLFCFSVDCATVCSDR
ncbi:hypothetical protein BJV78DRAFT_676040 [Lactifluus subvellereus]|nr:hypothetical protein BJV78DRAFT_676040 [Lactifluus subvellereus]